MTHRTRAGRRAIALVLAAVASACTQQVPAPPPPDPYAKTVRLDYRFKRTAPVPSLVTDFTVTNIGTAALRAVRITCDQTTLSGAHLGSRSLVVAGPVEPQASATHADFDSGFLRPSESHVTCRVSGIDT